ncbi:type I restriction enzyme HsdR N-terminal domain-containing protein [uncultured Cytophaga sp.]|uniref:type I restriction enzyme HsdR N-terminal domain-containing protein n=1 Tax=uncultured Cytophaga sp. TaxID=160238 RepID=UPI002611E5A9|nr:type I restriction enzyme HsdR N-terminal domain-containing protein [uncultured Cytophaga sp.]
MYPDLNLPTANLKLAKEQGEIYVYDIIRKKNILLTPEEWVRQHFMHYLIHTCKYPKSLFKVETGLQYNSLQKRSDIQIYNRKGSVFMLVECKAFSIPLSEQTLKQISAYNKTIEAEWIVITNGLTHYAFQREGEGEQIAFIKRNQLPEFI